MPTEETVRLIISFLGGGTVAGILSWIRAAASEKKARQIENLSDQLHNLYGPLFFFVSQNDNMFKLNSTFLNAYKAEYENKDRSRKLINETLLKRETSKVIDIANKYMEAVRHNNQKIVEVLVNNYACIDPDDVELFQNFLLDHTRMSTEVENDGTIQTPFEIYKRVGDISFMRPELIQRVQAKFYQKKREIEDLQR